MEEKKDVTQDEQELDQTLEVSELDDEDLEDAAGGGHNGNCGCVPK